MAPSDRRATAGLRFPSLHSRFARSPYRQRRKAHHNSEEVLSTVVAKLLDADEIEIEERLARLARSHRLMEERGEQELPDGAVATKYAFVHALYSNFLYESLVSKRRIFLPRSIEA
jgi:hypothetical protein